jgi:uncharacterized phiE125 gp8 family phage protein
VVQSVPPTDRAVDVGLLRQHLRLPADTGEAEVLPVYIEAAESAVQDELSVTVMQQTLVLRLDGFPAHVIQLPNPPLVSVVSIGYVDTLGVNQTVGASNYSVDFFSEPGRIVPVSTYAWPSTDIVPKAVTIIYVAGYAGPEVVPAEIRTAILLTAGEIYNHRERSAMGVVRDLDMYERLVANHRCTWEPNYR